MIKESVQYILIFVILITLTNSCKKEKLDYSTCYNCDNETFVDTLHEFNAKVVIFSHDPIVNNQPSQTYGFTIAKNEVESNSASYSFSDSLLVPCPAIPKNLQIAGTKVKISGYLKSCDNLLSCFNCTYFFGRKFELTNIHKQ